MNKPCAVCSASMKVPPHRVDRTRFCSRTCMGVARSKRMKGNRYRARKRPANAFSPGHSTWNDGLKGLHLSPATEFKKGRQSSTKAPVGDVRIRTDKAGRPRAWVKTGEPNHWRPRAQIVWESHHGAIPRGHLVHHEDRDTLNDEIGNLFAVSRRDHLLEHQIELRGVNR